jgi:hypothetical protein
MTPPASYVFTFDNCPWPNLLIDGAVIYALTSRGILEVANTFSYQDEISFAIDRVAKYQSMASLFYANWVSDRQRTKRQWSFSRAGAIGMTSTRMPFTIIRTLSLSFTGAQSTFSGLNY